jgi:hypothetical protein
MTTPERIPTGELVERARVLAERTHRTLLIAAVTALADRLAEQDEVLRIIGGIAWERAPGALQRVQFLADEATGREAVA